MEKTLLILECDEKCRNKIITFIESKDLNIQIVVADSLALAYKAVLESTIDIFVVDVILENDSPTDISGIRFIERVRQIPKYKFTPVIFLSSLEDPMLYAYKELNCIGFLNKNYREKELFKLLEKASYFTTKRNSDSILLFRKNGLIYPIKTSRIVCIEKIDKQMHILCADKKVLKIPYKTYKQILQEADSANLMLCNRSTLVNKEYIDSIDITNRYIILKGNRGRLDIGITYKNKIIEEFKV